MANPASPKWKGDLDSGAGLRARKARYLSVRELIRQAFDLQRDLAEGRH